MSLLDFLTLLSYVALNGDIIFQILRIHRTKSSADLSLLGMAIRYTGISIILIKFVSLHDRSLIMGQLLVVMTFAVYFLLAITYHVHRGNRKKR